MNKYNIYYNYDGTGKAIVEANSEEEAIEKFDNGDATYNDSGENYQLDFIEKNES